MPNLTRQQAAKLAMLAKLNLGEQEALLSSDIDSILSFVEKLKSVDTEGVPTTNQVTGLQSVWRKDEVVPSKLAEAILKNAPVQDGYIKVKRVLE